MLAVLLEVLVLVQDGLGDDVVKVVALDRRERGLVWHRAEPGDLQGLLVVLVVQVEVDVDAGDVAVGGFVDFDDLGVSPVLVYFTQLTLASTPVLDEPFSRVLP